MTRLPQTPIPSPRPQPWPGGRQPTRPAAVRLPGRLHLNLSLLSLHLHKATAEAPLSPAAFGAHRLRVAVLASAAALLCSLTPVHKAVANPRALGGLPGPSAGVHAAAPLATPVLVAAARPSSAQAATRPAEAAAPSVLAGEHRFDLSVNNAPATQVFLQLAQGTAYNMLVAPEVSGTLSVTLKNTTVPEAMDTMRELFGYDFRITGNRIFVYSNAVQTRLYRVNYLSGRRQGTSDIRVSSSAITQGSSSGGASTGTGNGSPAGAGGTRNNDNATVRTSSDADFWKEVQASLGALVGSQGGRSVVLNPAAGVVVVKATPSELRQVEAYLKAVQMSIERQVMLEAKIVEVSLSRESQTGINWGAFGKVLGDRANLSVGALASGATLTGKGASATITDGSTTISPGVNLAAGSLSKGFYGLAFQAANFAALMNFLESQGDVTVLSSPRIATLNNQKAVLKVGSDELYVTGVSTNTTTSGNSTVSSPSVTLTPFFSGISLDVTPQIDDAGNVMLHVHPTVSTVTEKQKNIDLGSMGAFKLPLAASAVNETDSIVRVRDGQIVAIGGLMKNEASNDRSGLPGMQNSGVFKHLLGQSGTVNTKRELVIMLKPTIIGRDGDWPESDLAAAASPAQAPRSTR